MAGYGARESRINRERKPRVNLCGACGAEVAETELLCDECEYNVNGDESVAMAGTPNAVSGGSTPPIPAMS